MRSAISCIELLVQAHHPLTERTQSKDDLTIPFETNLPIENSLALTMLLTIGMFPLLTVPIRVSDLVHYVVVSDTTYEPKHGVRGS